MSFLFTSFTIILVVFIFFVADISGDEGTANTSIAEYIISRNKRLLDYPCTSPKGSVPFMVPMLAEIINRFMMSEVVVLLYDEYFNFLPLFQVILDNLLKLASVPIRLGKLDTTFTKPRSPEGFMDTHNIERLSFIIFSKDIEIGGDLLVGNLVSETKVVLISQSSIFLAKKYLSSKAAQHIVNLLVVVDLTLKIDLFTQRKRTKSGECDIILYSHRLNVDPVGNSYPVVITAWRRTEFTRKNVDLFPDKFKHGLNGYHLIVSASEKPPFVFRKRGQQEMGSDYLITTWEGIEVRLIKLLGEVMNFTVEFKEPTSTLNIEEDSADTVLFELNERRADVALGGIYMTTHRNQKYDFIYPHTQDCAAFISLTSLALSKYRAIMGPFLWDVWLALIITYLLAIFPIAFSVWHSFAPLLKNPREIEHMFWYVFGTFTNCFTFSGKNSWSKGDKTATRFFIGTYWVFTIIITSCYTGCIIAFITLPVFPEVIETLGQLVEQNFKLTLIGTGGWYKLVNESADPLVAEMMDDLDLVEDYIQGLRNVTDSIHSDRQSVFLGSRHVLEYIVRTNYTPSDSSKRMLFHISNECFVPMMVNIAFRQGTFFREHLNVALSWVAQSGFLAKITREVNWIVYRSATGKLLQARSIGLRNTLIEDRELTLDDTQGMFLLLAIGFSLALFALIGELTTWIWHETRGPTEFGMPPLDERILGRIGKWISTIKMYLFAPLDIHNRVSRFFQERRESKLNRLSELFGSEVSLDLNDATPTSNAVKSTGHLEQSNCEQPIRLRSF